MTDEQSFTIDILKIIPKNAICFIQAPSVDESSALRRILEPSEFSYFEQITLTEVNKQKLIDVVISEGIEEYFQSLQIKLDNSLLCEAFDGMVMVILSKNFNVPTWFSEKYINTDLCVVSNIW